MIESSFFPGWVLLGCHWVCNKAQGLIDCKLCNKQRGKS